jgi:asparagine synthetase B (glutamine-hydrolysing)
MRYVEVVYGPTEDKHAMLIYGGDIWVEFEPRKWARLCDLPSTHPANQLLARGGLQAAIFIDGSGQQITRLNAYNEAHRKLAAEQGLFISVPFSEDKRKELLETLQKIKEELQILSESRFLELQGRIEKIKERLSLLKDLKALENEIEERAKAQSLWDSAVNETVSLTEALERAIELSNMVFPTRYEQWATRQAVQKAKREAILEEKIESSVLLNPERLRELRAKLLG